jgi:hypothetical protein
MSLFVKTKKSQKKRLLLSPLPSPVLLRHVSNPQEKTPFTSPRRETQTKKGLTNEDSPFDLPGARGRNTSQSKRPPDTLIH